MPEKALYDPQGRRLYKGESYRKSDGRYVYRYTILKKTYSIYASTLKELRQKEKEVEKRRGQGLKSTNQTLNSLFYEYMEDKNLKHTTRMNYLYMWEKFVKNSLGLRNVKDITPDDIDRFYRKLLRKDKEKTEGTLSISTLDTLHTVIHPTLQKAVRKRLIPSNPAYGLMKDLKQEGYKKTKRYSLSLEDQTRFLNYIRESKTYSRWYPIFVIALGTALRVGELVGLRWEDILFDTNEISVNHQLVYSLERPSDPDNPRPKTLKDGDSPNCRLFITTPKTEQGVRVIHMFPEVREALLELYNKRPKETPVIDGYTHFIFINRQKGVQTPSTLNRVIERIVRDFNEEEDERALKEEREAKHLPKFSCHVLRHTACTRLFEAGADMTFMKNFMGHADIQTTMDIYTDLLPEKAKELSKGLEDRFRIS